MEDLQVLKDNREEDQEIQLVDHQTEGDLIEEV